MSHTFTITGPAMGYQRARHKGRVHWHTREQIEYAARLQAAGLSAFRVLGKLDLAEVSITIYHRHRKVGGIGKPCLGKPDADNVAKLVLDGLTASGLWVDDTRVARLAVERLGCTPGAERVEVTIRRIGGDA